MFLIKIDEYNNGETKVKDIKEGVPCKSANLIGLTIKKINLNEVINGGLPKGSLIMVRWLDASEVRASLREHESEPEDRCKDWGLYLGVSGRARRMLIVGKDVVEVHNMWGATRIPVELIEEVYLILPREEMSTVIREVQTLGRRINLRKYRRKEERVVVRAH